MKIIVTGGGGFLGKSLCKVLIEKGYQVHSLARSSYPELESIGVETHRIDISADYKSYVDLFTNVDAVYHVAAKVDMWGPYIDFYNVNVVGTRNILKCCEEKNVPRLVYTSSPSVIADGQDLNGIDESYPYPKKHHAFYPQTKAVAEREVLASNSNKLKTIALRPHLIWGPGDTNLVPTIIERARAGRLVQVGNGENLVDTCYIEDCVQAHIKAEESLRNKSEKASGKVFFISQGEPVNMWKWINDILLKNDLEQIKKKLPFSVAYTLAFLCELVSRVFPFTGEPLLTRFLVSEMATSHYFSLKNARELIGYEPRYSIKEAMDLTFQGK